MLIAHVDTVFRQPIRQFTYNEKRAVYKGKEGLGADDRAGVFAIIQIYAKNIDLMSFLQQMKKWVAMVHIYLLKHIQ